MKHDHYQTIRLPDGTVREGVFDTQHWYDRMHSQVEVKDKSLLDVGCNLGGFCMRAMIDGAVKVKGIDHDGEVIDEARVISGFKNCFDVADIESYEPDQDYDIVLFSMIIHWIGERQFLRLVEYAKDTVVVIFRSKNAGYRIPTNGKWFPTLETLTRLMGTKNFVLKHDEVLLEQDSNKKIILAVYGKSGI